MSEDRVALYRDTRQRYVVLLRSLSADELQRPVLSCPGWTVLDVVAHSVGSATDVVTGNLEAVSTAPWTAAQVEARRGRTLDELLAEWDEYIPALEEVLDARAMRGSSLLIVDLATHEQDIRGAVGRPGGRDSAGYRLSWKLYLRGLEYRIRQAELPALLLRSEEGESLAGAGEPAATVSAFAFELWRAVAGRRSLGQIAAYDWEGDATPYIPIIPTFSPPEADVVE